MSRRLDPVKMIVKKTKFETIRLYDSGDEGWMLDTGSGHPFPASPFEVILWNELEKARLEIKKLRHEVVLLKRTGKTC